jgi:uncharacterized membrane protein
MINHLKSNVMRGLIALIPFGLCLIAIRLIYYSIDQRMVSLLGDRLGVAFPGLGILLLVVSLYLIGVVTSNVVGRRFLSLADLVTSRVPIIKTAYQVGKQITTAFSQPGKQTFKRVVLVEMRPKTWVVGLVTGSTEDVPQGESYLNVYVPLPPNPTAGMFMLVSESEVRDPGWTVEEALKMLMSVGIIGPSRITS